MSNLHWWAEWLTIMKAEVRNFREDVTSLLPPEDAELCKQSAIRITEEIENLWEVIIEHLGEEDGRLSPLPLEKPRLPSRGQPPLFLPIPP